MSDIGDTTPTDTGDTTPINPILLRQLFDFFPALKDISVELAQSQDRDLADNVTTGGGTSTASGIRALVKSINADSLTCAILDEDGGEGDLVLVARDQELQRTPFDGNSVGGITYAYSDNVTRTATLDEDETVQAIQEIYPLYVVDFTEIWISEAADGTGLSGVNYFDMNTAGRAWVKTGVPAP